MLLTRRPSYLNLYDEAKKSGDQFFNLFDQLFHSHGMPTINGITKPDFVPSLDAVEKESEYVLHLELPGISEQEVKISVEENTLSIAGEKKNKTEEKTDEIHVSEIYFGAFRREITLPQNVDIEKIQASYDQGILSINIPKKEEGKKKKREIEIKKLK